MKLLFATKNDMKYMLMKERLKGLDIELIIPKMLDIDIEVSEDGLTEEENAIKKAKEYYDICKIPTIAEDSGLYIDKFPSSEQPRMYVKRINGKEGLSDDVILKYYIDKLNKYGGNSLASYHTGVCIIDSNGSIHSHTIEEEKFLLTKDICKNFTKINGSVLDCISYDLKADKYFCKRSEEDKKTHYEKLDKEYKELVKKYVLNI